MTDSQTTTASEQPSTAPVPDLLVAAAYALGRLDAVHLSEFTRAVDDARTALRQSLHAIVRYVRSASIESAA